MGWRDRIAWIALLAILGAGATYVLWPAARGAAVRAIFIVCLYQIIDMFRRAWRRGGDPWDRGFAVVVLLAWGWALSDTVIGWTGLRPYWLWGMLAFGGYGLAWCVVGERKFRAQIKALQRELDEMFQPQPGDPGRAP